MKLICYKSLYNRDEVHIQSLSDIIKIIQSNELLKLIDGIRKCTTKEEKANLKLKLPTFHPNFKSELVNSDTTIEPSGIIGFDIDLKDNAADFDVDKFKKEITSIPSCIYSYISPSGGLKFGIKTDLTDVDNDEDSLSARFKLAYKLTLKYLRDNVDTNFIADRNMMSFRSTSYFSHDTNAYINIDAAVLDINSQCIYEPLTSSPAEPMYEAAYILELLKYIPKDLKYVEQLTINYSVLSSLGESGIDTLLNHWGKAGKDRATMKSKIESQLKNLKFGSIGHLVNVATKNGYKPVPVKSRRKIVPKDSGIKLPPLLSPDEGSAKLRVIVQDFFKQFNDVFVNVSTGAGKSTAVLDVLAKEIPYNKKILFLAPSHKLAEELEQKFKTARNRPDVDVMEANKQITAQEIRLKTFKKPVAGIIHLHGKEKLCQSEFAKKEFSGVDNIPWKFCSSCHHHMGCAYIEQFNNRFDNIRIMTHNEWSNNQSAWFGGSDEVIRYQEIRGDFVKINDEYVKLIQGHQDGYPDSVEINGKNIQIIDGQINLDGLFVKVDGEYVIDGNNEYQAVNGEELEISLGLYPSDKKWVPDFIIIDENIIAVAVGKVKRDNGHKHESISNIIRDVNQGMSFRRAVDNNLSDIERDSRANNKPKFPSFKGSIVEYMHEMRDWRLQLKSYSEVIKRLDDYAITKEMSHLLGMWVADSSLHFAPVTQVAKRYQDIPTLFLDATANESVVHKVLGNVKFHTIAIQSKSDINLYQLANTTITKTYVNDADKRAELVSWIKSIIKDGKYENVGLITYISYFNSAGKKCKFDEYLAEQTGVKIWGHFGDIRGIDKFDKVDCLLIVGRHHIGTGDETSDEPSYGASHVSAAIFGEFEKFKSVNAEMPVRMKDGKKYFLNSWAMINENHIAINEHFSLAETKQAIGRSRAIHGKKKDVFFFSNESLGMDIEVTDFFYREEKDTITVTEELISKIKAVGYVLNTPKALVSAGFLESDAKSRRRELINRLAENEIHLFSCTMTDAAYRKSPMEYFIADESKFIVGQKYNGKKLDSFVIVP